MTNGFYNTSRFKTNKQKEKFIRDIIGYCYAINIENNQSSWQRQEDRKKSINEYFDIIFNNNSDLRIIDRYSHSKGLFKDNDGEIVLFGGSYFIYCHLSLENLNKIIEKYNLKLKEW